MKTVGYIPKNGKPKDGEKPKPGAADGSKQDGGKTETAITDGNKADGVGGNGSKPKDGAE